MIISLSTGESIDDQIAKAREMQRNINMHIGMLTAQKVAMERGAASSCVSVKPSGYVCLNVAEKAAAKLHTFLKGLGLSSCVPAADMHTTLVYDKSNPVLNAQPDHSAHTVKIKGVKRLGEPGSKWEAIVLELDAPTVVQRHMELRQLGFKHSYPAYIPHLSVCYQPKPSDFDAVAKKIDAITEYMGKFDLVHETWKHLDAD